MGVRQLPGIVYTLYMSHTSFIEIFSTFKRDFPPVDTVDQAHLQLTTSELLSMIQNLTGNMNEPDDGMFSFLKDQGYTYHPKEYNEKVSFVWLVGKRDG